MTFQHKGETEMELLDLYDAGRRPLNRTIRRGETIPEDCYHIIIHICIFNSKGEMLIQQRQTTKTSWPNLWDFSVGGTVSAGENSGIGAERELMEELGIRWPLHQERPYLTIHYDHGFDDVYILNMDIDPAELKLQKEEVQQVRWASPAEVEQLLESEQFIPYRKEFIRLLFALQSGRGTCLK